MANGAVTIGFSKPWVAKYAYSDSAVSYSEQMILARGVSVSASIETSDDNEFYADNTIAEKDNGSFESGTLSLTVDGLLPAAEKFIFGLPTADDAGFVHYNKTMSIPEVGVGFVVKQRSGGVDSYLPVVFTRCIFSVPDTEASTQEESVEWQTQSLEATIMCDESADETWKVIGTACTTEAAAEALIKAFLA